VPVITWPDGIPIACDPAITHARIHWPDIYDRGWRRRWRRVIPITTADPDTDPERDVRTGK
jgi:hypothetical protein